MRPPIYTMFLICLLLISCQEPAKDGRAVVEHSIAYHDPQGQWPAFAERLYIKQETPGGSRQDVIEINLPGQYFKHSSTRDSVKTVRVVDGDAVRYSRNRQTDLPDSLVVKYRLTDEQILRYRDYFTYLYGLPMKLRDLGTNIHPEVEQVTFYDRDALKVKVSYDEGVGEDTWYFYFDPESYAMLAYQFFHDETANDGEYILLEGEVKAGGLRLPGDRTWYTNKEEKLLGTDFLQKTESLN